MARELGRLKGSRWLFKTDDPNVVILRFRTWVSFLNPKAGFECVVDARDPQSLARAKYNLMMHVAERDMDLSAQAEKELDDWFLSRPARQTR